MSYAGSVDQGFAERIARIEKGKQWRPDGVVMPSGRARKKKLGLQRRNRMITLLLSLVLMAGLFSVFANLKPELAGSIMAGDLSGVAATLASVTGG